MGYKLQAVIAADELLRAVSREMPGARVVTLGQGLSLIPMTDEVFDAVTHGSNPGELGFWRLPGGFDTLLAQWSAAGPIAYVEAEYFGGVGEQRAAVWADGSLSLGPLDEPSEKRFATGQPYFPSPPEARGSKNPGRRRVRVRGAGPPPHQRGLDLQRLLGGASPSIPASRGG